MMMAAFKRWVHLNKTRMKKIFSIAILFCALSSNGQDYKNFPMWNYNLPIEQRVNDVVSRLTLEEKVHQMLNATPAIPRTMPHFSPELLMRHDSLAIAYCSPHIWASICRNACWNYILLRRAMRACSRTRWAGRLGNVQRFNIRNIANNIFRDL